MYFVQSFGSSGGFFFTLSDVLENVQTLPDGIGRRYSAVVGKSDVSDSPTYQVSYCKADGTWQAGIQEYQPL